MDIVYKYENTKHALFKCTRGAHQRLQ